MLETDWTFTLVWRQPYKCCWRYYFFCLPKNQLLFFHQWLWRRTILPMLYQQLKALYWANLLMNLSTKPLYKIRSRDSWSFRITKVCYSTMSNTSATANQDEKLMNKCCKVHRLPQKLSDLLLESSLDDDCKKNTTTNAIKKLKLTDFKFQW